MQCRYSSAFFWSEDVTAGTTFSDFWLRFLFWVFWSLRSLKVFNVSVDFLMVRSISINELIMVSSVSRSRIHVGLHKNIRTSFKCPMLRHRHFDTNIFGLSRKISQNVDGRSSSYDLIYSILWITALITAVTAFGHKNLKQWWNRQWSILDDLLSCLLSIDKRKNKRAVMDDVSSTELPPYIPCGLYNHGNSCFMSSVIQCLSVCSPLNSLLSTIE